MTVGKFKWTSSQRGEGISGATFRRVCGVYNRAILVMFLVAVMGLGGLVLMNRVYAPEMYSSAGPEKIAQSLASDRNYAVFDLNLNIRALRDAHIGLMPEAPKLAILGASHWQEAHSEIVPVDGVYNAHVHRDYYEDMLAVVEMFVRHDKLPKKLVMSIRDNLFTPVALRRDFLWLPGIPYYRSMAPELGLTTHSAFSTMPVQRWREQISVPMLFDNVTRWYNASERPHETTLRYFRSLDTLLPDGSIVWSRDHRTAFTQDRAMRLAKAHAKELANLPPVIDPKGAEAIDTLLSYLVKRGVDVTLAHPPFNPYFFELVRNSPYMAGLKRVEALTTSLAEKHKLQVIGSFDPAPLGCTSEMYIDAEHANPECLHRIFLQLDPSGAPAQVARVAATVPYEFDMDQRQANSWLRTARSSMELASQLKAIQLNIRPVPARVGEDTDRPILKGTIVAGVTSPSEVSELTEPPAVLRRSMRRVSSGEPKPAPSPKMASPKPARKQLQGRVQQNAKPTMTWPGDAPAIGKGMSGRAQRANAYNG